MKFRDNLVHLRAVNNMTQEQLAMLLGVSRQSVAKWEAGKSSPEMDKLLALCQVFGCTLDDLVQGDLSGSGKNPALAASTSGAPVDMFGYDELMRTFSGKIANGVMAIILGVALAVMIFALGDPDAVQPLALPENASAALGMIALFAGVACGVGLIVPAGMTHAAFVKAHPYLEDFYTEGEKQEARSSFARGLVAGLVLIFLGVCIILALADTSFEAIAGVPLMLACIAVGVRFIVRSGIMMGRVNIEGYNEAWGQDMSAADIERLDVSDEQKAAMLARRRQSRIIGTACGTIMIIATIVGLMLLFVPAADGSYDSVGRNLFWLAWPIGGMLCGIVTLIVKATSKDEE